MNTAWRIVQGDALERLRELDTGSVQTCVTSPPYFGLRDYGTSSWEGGDEGCDHAEVVNTRRTYYANSVPGPAGSTGKNAPMRNETKEVGGECASCGATRTDSQVGLEATPDEYVARLVEVFREVRRVLRDDGTLWLNLGDSYATGGGRSVGRNDSGKEIMGRAVSSKTGGATGKVTVSGCKDKDLVGVPWMVAFALRADGWYLRSDIIWAKPNPMPESVTDRPTKAHEYLFLLSKSKSYFYDADAVREDWADDRNGASGATVSKFEDMGSRGRGDGGITNAPTVTGRNKRSVWTVATQPFPGAHFAVFPPKLIEPCVLAGSAEDACGVCGAPWERVADRVAHEPDGYPPSSDMGSHDAATDVPGARQRLKMRGGHFTGGSVSTVGWWPTCGHTGYTVSGSAEHENNLAAQTRARAEGMKAIPHPTEAGAWQVVSTPTSSTVLDPFAGAGTTGLVATRLGRSFIGIELNPEYAEMARERIRDDAPLWNWAYESFT